jgi:hypothetical protein
MGKRANNGSQWSASSKIKANEVRSWKLKKKRTNK